MKNFFSRLWNWFAGPVDREQAFALEKSPPPPPAAKPKRERGPLVVYRAGVLVGRVRRTEGDSFFKWEMEMHDGTVTGFMSMAALRANVKTRGEKLVESRAGL